MKNKKENFRPEDIVEIPETIDVPADESTDFSEEVTVEILDESALAEKKYDELNDRYLRLIAEYDNFRKRTQREKDELYGNATAATIEKILPILDNFERASSFEQGSEDFKKGFDLIYTNFRDVLEMLGVEVFGAPGDLFDPSMHNAVSHIEDDDLGENTIAQVMQKGYRLGGRIIRYAMVQSAN